MKEKESDGNSYDHADYQWAGDFPGKTGAIPEQGESADKEIKNGDQGNGVFQIHDQRQQGYRNNGHAESTDRLDKGRRRHDERDENESGDFWRHWEL